MASIEPGDIDEAGNYWDQLAPFGGAGRKGLSASSRSGSSTASPISSSSSSLGTPSSSTTAAPKAVGNPRTDQGGTSR